MKLDLHGIKHGDVGKELDSFLYEQFKTNNLQIEIITGKSTAMKNIVKDLLIEYGLEVGQELEGSLIIDL